MRILILFMLLGISVAASGQPYTSYQINFKGSASATIDGDIKVIDAMTRFSEYAPLVPICNWYL